jgi:hypothetical protein
MAIHNRLLQQFDHFSRTRAPAYRCYRQPHLKYVTKEPERWPLTRPATSYEWAHVLKVMIMRRVPKKRGVHRDRLFEFVNADLMLSSDSGRFYVDADFQAFRRVDRELDRMICKDRTLINQEYAVDTELGSEAPLIYRTDYSAEWSSLVPVAVQAIVEFLPTANLLDLMVSAIDDEDQADI